MNFKILFTFFVLAATGQLIAGEDVPLNGDFKGAAGTNIPGWSLQSGSVKTVYAGDNEYCAELQGEGTLVSARYPVTGDQLELKAEVRGSGIGRISYIIFDREGNQLKHYADGIRFSAQNRKSKVRALLNIPREAASLSVVLSAGKNSIIAFEDIEAEFERPRPVIAVAAGQTPLVDERRYRLNDLNNITWTVTLAPGKDIEFKLEESDTAKWQVKSVDNRICRIAVEHDRDGFWPLYRYDAEVEIKAIRRGKGEIILQHASGKEMKISVLVN